MRTHDMTKKTYEAPDITVLKLQVEDVLTSSSDPFFGEDEPLKENTAFLS